jgi:hypothetical protein
VPSTPCRGARREYVHIATCRRRKVWLPLWSRPASEDRMRGRENCTENCHPIATLGTQPGSAGGIRTGGGGSPLRSLALTLGQIIEIRSDPRSPTGALDHSIKIGAFP